MDAGLLGQADVSRSPRLADIGALPDSEHAGAWSTPATSQCGASEDPHNATLSPVALVLVQGQVGVPLLTDQ